MPHHIESDELELAGLGRRAASAVLDVILPAATAGVATLAVRPAAVGVLLVLVLLVQWGTLGRRGWTVGRAATGLRTLDVETRRPIGMARVLVRVAVLVAGALVGGVGLLVVLASPAFDRTGRRRGWHDRAAGDEVFDVRGRGAARRAARLAAPRHASVPETPRGGSAGAWQHGQDGRDGQREQDGQHGQDRQDRQDRQDVSTADVRQPVEAGVTTPAPAPAWLGGAHTGTAQLEAWLDAGAERPTLVLAPLGPDRRGPDLDTRAIPVVRAVVTAPADVADVDERPRHAGLDPDVEMTRRAPRGDAPLEPPVVAAARPATAEIELGDGRRFTVERTALVGRNPAAGSDVQLVRVVDPGRSVSKTHLQIGVEPGGVWVADRGSTNGTVVTLPGGGQVVCGVDQQVRLRVGAVVRFGDCTLRLVREPGAGAGS